VNAIATAKPEAKPRIVIVGAGFAGVKCAQVLLKQRRDAVEIVVFNRDNHMTFVPLLPDVAGSSLNPRAVAPPLRQLLPGATCRTEEVIELDLERNALTYEGHDGAPRQMRYDHLVIACGNVVNLNLLPGMGSHALPLKTVGDAIALRSHVMRQLEKADLAESEAQRHFYLTFAVVGGGFSGVEVAGELNDLIRGSLKQFPNLRREDVMVTLLHGQDEILPEVSPALRRFARERMLRRGIRFLCGKAVTEVTRQGVRLADGQRVEGATVVCTVGTTANPLIAKLDLRKERGRLVTEPDMRLPGHRNVWAVGDCAWIANAHDGKPAPPTAQFGEREGGQCALNIGRVLEGDATEPFRYKPVGVACGIGGRQGVAELFGLKFSGFAAWWLWRSGFLVKIPSLAQKVKVGLDWAWELVFPRDLSHFRPAQTEAVGHAHYAPGEILFRRGDPLKELFVIEAGEAEIALYDDTAGDYVHAHAIAAGAVVGEATLAEFPARNAVVRARTPLEVLVLGKQSLSKLSRALKPVEDLLDRAVNRPKLSIWRHHPTAMKALAMRRAGELPTAYAMIAVDRGTTLGAVFQRLIEERGGCAVVTEAGRLVGVTTRSDLLAALARGATRTTPIGEAMNPRAISVRADDSAATAAEQMADGGLKFLPVLDADGRPTALLTSDDFVRFALAMPR
jgi:NADH dehydrogenase